MKISPISNLCCWTNIQQCTHSLECVWYLQLKQEDKTTGFWQSDLYFSFLHLRFIIKQGGKDLKFETQQLLDGCSFFRVWRVSYLKYGICQWPNHFLNLFHRKNECHQTTLQNILFRMDWKKVYWWSYR